MNEEISKWRIKVNRKLQEFEVECDPPNYSNRRYMLKIFPKNMAQIKKEILVIMLNPSIADKYSSDKTCRDLINLCDCNGYNSITICNLFSSRGQVKELNEFMENGTANDNSSDEKLKEQIEKFDEVLCAWGKVEELEDRNLYNIRINKVYEMLTNKKLKEFGHTSFNGDIYPNHPYYVHIKSKDQWKINEHKPWT